MRENGVGGVLLQWLCKFSSTDLGVNAPGEDVTKLLSEVLAEVLASLNGSRLEAGYLHAHPIKFSGRGLLEWTSPLTRGTLAFLTCGGRLLKYIVVSRVFNTTGA